MTTKLLADEITVEILPGLTCLNIFESENRRRDYD
jgi:hypothetical protein